MVSVITAQRATAALGGTVPAYSHQSGIVVPITEGRRVTDVALEVGYASLSASAKALSQLLGEAPKTGLSIIQVFIYLAMDDG
jgi:hypothetical protein